MKYKIENFKVRILFALFILSIFVVIHSCIVFCSLEKDKDKNTLKEISKKEETIITYVSKKVRVSVYKCNERECDKDFLTTASGFRVNKKNIKKDKTIAISRDLKKYLSFNDSIYLDSNNEYEGYYVVRDLMNKRFKDSIDILIEDSSNINLFNAEIYFKLK